MPRLFIISGCNGSGKTTASYAALPETLGCSQFVNSDEFAKSLAPFKPESAYVAASRYMLLKIRYLFKRKEDFCIETTLATRSLKKMIRDAKADIAQAEIDLEEGQKKVDDAREELADLKEPSTYVLGRDKNAGYAALENDTAIVKGIAKVFPLFFFLFAAMCIFCAFAEG